MLHLQSFAKAVITDSGGVQKESFYLKTPCVTTRSETEWPETVELGWNRLVPPDSEIIVESALKSMESVGADGNPYGEGNASEKILDLLLRGSWKNYF
jgi:UDP-N-acetylglucosamine 2-epimerase